MGEGEGEGGRGESGAVDPEIYGVQLLTKCRLTGGQFVGIFDLNSLNFGFVLFLII